MLPAIRSAVSAPPRMKSGARVDTTARSAGRCILSVGCARRSGGWKRGRRALREKVTGDAQCGGVSYGATGGVGAAASAKELKPKFGDIGGVYYTDVSQDREARRQAVKNKIALCRQNTSFVSNTLDRKYPRCLPIFRERSRGCVEDAQQYAFLPQLGRGTRQRTLLPGLLRICRCVAIVLKSCWIAPEVLENINKNNRL